MGVTVAPISVSATYERQGYSAVRPAAGVHGLPHNNALLAAWQLSWNNKSPVDQIKDPNLPNT